MARTKRWGHGENEASSMASHAPKKKKTKKSRSNLIKEGSNEDVLIADVRALLEAQEINDPIRKSLPGQAATPVYKAPERFSEILVTISEISSTGDGLGLSEHSDHVYVVPFTAPGDVVQAKLANYNSTGRYTIADFVKVHKASPMRDDSRIKCPYFSKCSGCQFQMMSYEDQLYHKKAVIERAYKNFSDLPPEVIPPVGDTIGSPLQYGYRTKLTPHFDRPLEFRRKQQNQAESPFSEVPPIGFMNKGVPRTLDIEDCPIGTDAVRAGLKSERKRVAEELTKYRNGATLLLRESTTRTPKQAQKMGNSHSNVMTTNEQSSKPETDTLAVDANTSSYDIPYTESKICITDPKGTSTEYVDDYIFTNPASSFFQNNNSILPQFTAYIREHILGTKLTTKPPITNLLDAYSGSGLFTITLSQLFQNSIGIDISSQSIACATRNAELNKISNTRFVAATASAIFGSVESPPDETAVVVDPPRKGCDEEFLTQLLEYGPRRVVYVSCNVHTQARDVGVLVEGKFGARIQDSGKETNKDTHTGKRTRYKLESLRGFDFFPQTSHVEGVAVLERVDEVDK